MMNHAEAEALLINAGYNPVLGVAAQERLLQACKSGPAAEVEAWITLGVPVNIHDSPLGETPLIHATEGGHADIIGLLLAAGADPNATDSSGDHALLTAVNWSKPQLIDPLIAAGSELNLLSKKKWSPLSAAIHKEQPAVALKLLAAGADPNVGSKAYVQPLVHLRPGQGQVLTALVAAGADLNAPMHADGTTIAMHLLLKGLVDTTSAVMQGADPAITNAYGWTAPMCAAWVRDGRPLPQANDRDPYGRSALMLLAEQKSWAPLQILLEQGADPTPQANGWSALTWAVKHKKADIVSMLIAKGAPADEEPGRSNALLQAARYGDDDLVKRLLDAGASVRGTNEDGYTALSMAAFAGRNKAVKLLLKAGADPNHADNTGKTPLMLATLWFHQTIINTLLKERVNVNAQSADGKTALHYLAGESTPSEPYSKCLSAMLKAGADLDIADHSGTTVIVDLQKRPLYKQVLTAHAHANPRCYAALIFAIHTQDLELARQSLIDARLSALQRNEALLSAAATGSTALVELLLSHGADPNYAGWRGYTPLMRAANSGSTEAVQALLTAGADPNAQTEHGYTALGMATWGDHIAVLERLFAAGAKIQPIPAGSTPLAQAISSKAVAAVAWLMAHGADPTTRIPGGQTLHEAAAKKGLNRLI